MLRIMTIAAGVVAVSGAASATTIDAHFDLRAYYGSAEYGLQDSFVLEDNGLTATFTGRYFNPSVISGNTIGAGSLVGDGQIGRYASGAGVTNATTDNTHEVDGRGYDDFIQIVFDQSTAVHEINLSYFHEDYQYDDYDLRCSWRGGCRWVYDETVYVDRDDFRWMVDSNLDGSIGVGDWISDDISDDPFSSFTGEFATVWGFGAFGDNDAWKLKTVNVKYDPAVIPLPASVFLLLGAVGGLGYMGRRKKA